MAGTSPAMTGGDFLPHSACSPTSTYSAVPDLPGCVSVGDSLDEVKAEIREAIEFHLEGMREDGAAIPKPSSQHKPNIIPLAFLDHDSVTHGSILEASLPEDALQRARLQMGIE
jgi:predicted RNase H-like HicB family nuclease